MSLAVNGGDDKVRFYSIYQMGMHILGTQCFTYIIYIYTPGTKYIGVYSFCLFCNYVCLFVCLFVCKLFFSSKISQQLLGLGF